jgi:hypothetical protein
VATTEVGQPRRRAIEHPGRFAIVAVGLTAVAVLFAGAITTADTKERRTALPAQVQSVSPRPGTIVPPQEQIVVDLRDDLTADLSVCTPAQAVGDCTPIPADQVEFVPGLGQLTYRPGPDQEIEAFDPGVNRVIVAYRSQADPSKDTGVFSWSFTSKS